MPQIKIEVTARRKRIFEALCLKNDCNMEALFEGKMIDLEVNAAGLDLNDTPEDQEDAVARLERKAARAQAEREASQSEDPAQTTTTN